MIRLTQYAYEAVALPAAGGIAPPRGPRAATAAASPEPDPYGRIDRIHIHRGERLHGLLTEARRAVSLSPDERAWKVDEANKSLDGGQMTSEAVIEEIAERITRKLEIP